MAATLRLVGRKKEANNKPPNGRGTSDAAAVRMRVVVESQGTAMPIATRKVPPRATGDERNENKQTVENDHRDGRVKRSLFRKVSCQFAAVFVVCWSIRLLVCWFVWLFVWSWIDCFVDLWWRACH